MLKGAPYRTIHYRLYTAYNDYNAYISYIMSCVPLSVREDSFELGWGARNDGPIWKNSESPAASRAKCQLPSTSCPIDPSLLRRSPPFSAPGRRLAREGLGIGRGLRLGIRPLGGTDVRSGIGPGRYTRTMHRDWWGLERIALGMVQWKVALLGTPWFDATRRTG